MRFVAAACALLSFALASMQPAPLQITRVIHGHFDPRDGETARYQYLPLEVSAGTEALTISYRFSGDNGASVIDLGLFEPGPLTLGTSSFRGYSGGAQRTITVGRHAASPGYGTGRLPAGQWHVLLGLYKVAPEGVDVDVEVIESHEQAPIDAGSPPELRATLSRVSSGGGPRWYVGGLHLHTTHSDGSTSPGAVADMARAAGLEFIVVTDHNNTTHARERMAASPLHIIGEEVTTPAGHANVWGVPANGWIDFRVMPHAPGAAQQINGLVAEAHRAGALFSINHPFGDCGGCSWGQTIPDALDSIEIWNGEKGPQDQAVAMWDRLLRAGRRVTAVGASDWHRTPARIDAAAVRVLASELTETAILDNIRRGHVIVMRDAQSAPPVVRVSCGAAEAVIGDALTCAAGATIAVRVFAPDEADGRADFVWNGDRAGSKRIGEGAMFTVPASAGYLRVHVYAADGVAVAITNPIYVATR